MQLVNKYNYDRSINFLRIQIRFSSASRQRMWLDFLLLKGQ